MIATMMKSPIVGKKPLQYVLYSRHHPAIFDSIISIFNDYGLVMPLNKELGTDMPYICDLMRLNTFSSTAMKQFLTERDFKLLQNSPNKECLFFDEFLPEQQFSNIGMATAIVCFLSQIRMMWSARMFAAILVITRSISTNTSVWD